MRSFVASLALVFAAACAVPASQLAPHATVPLTTLVVPTSAAVVDEGRRLYFARGCSDCHGSDLGGARVVHVPLVMRLWGDNLTADVDDVERFDRAVRHGVNARGTALVGMPSQEFQHLADDEVEALYAFVVSAPVVDRAPPRAVIGPLAWIADRLDVVPLVASRRIDHAAPRMATAPRAASIENGARIVHASCVGCHGESLSGRRVPGLSSRNLTAHDDGLVAWTETDFRRALREGLRPDGAAVGAAMPWRAFSQLTDDEIAAAWAYLRSLPPRATGR